MPPLVRQGKSIIAEQSPARANKKAWAVEVKWKGKSAGRNELEAFTGKITGMPVMLWYVSKSGFTTEARKYAADASIMLSNEAELQELATLL